MEYQSFLDLSLEVFLYATILGLKLQ